MRKKSKMKRLFYRIPICLLACSLNAHAQTYLTLEGGKAFADMAVSHFKDFNASIKAAGGQARLNQGDNDTAFVFGAGHQFHANWGLELLYINMGKVSARSTSSDTVDTSTRKRTITERVDQDALAANLTARWLVKDTFVLKASVGLGLVRQKSKGQADGQTLDASGQNVVSDSESKSFSSREWAPVLGLGAGYQINEGWQLQMNWRRVANLNPDVLGTMDVDIFTFGLQYRF